MQNKSFKVRIQRQDHPSKPSYWQTFMLDYEASMNITSVLQRIAVKPETQGGEKVTPVAYDAGCLEEVCGSCTMVINGRVRQACSALVDSLLEGEIYAWIAADSFERWRNSSAGSLSITTTTWGRANRAATLHTLRKFFDG